MQNNLDNFEKLIKDSLEGYEVPYNPEHWEELENSLMPVAEPTVVSYITSVASGLALTVAILFSLLYFIPEKGVDQAEQINNNEQNLISEDKGSGENSPESNTAEIELLDSSENISERKNELITEISPITEVKSPKPKVKKQKNLNPVPNTPVNSEAGNSNIVVVKPEKAKFNSTFKKGCTGLTIEFSLDKVENSARYLWNFGDGYFSSEAHPVHTFNKPGTFDVSLSVTSNANGSISSNVIQGMIVVEESPQADFSLKLKDQDHLEIKNLSNNASNVEWSIEDEKYNFENNRLIDLSTGKHNIVVTAVNDNGCSDSISKKIDVKDRSNLNAPKEFNPAQNGNGFMPARLLNTKQSFDLMIYNADSNNLVFESNNANETWNGKLNNTGESLPEGNYQWVVLLENAEGVSEIHKGTVELKK